MLFIFMLIKGKILLLFIITLQCLNNCKGQNLVLNGNFENYLLCNGVISNAPNWYNPTNASPDYLNACNTDLNYAVPYNVYGNQIAHSGVAYAFIAIALNWFHFREYISTPLTNPLIKDSLYCFEMYVSLADSSEYGIDNLGVLFTNGPIDTTGQGGYIVNFTPQLSTTNIIINTMNWTLVKGSFIANGGEDHLTIGCFVPDDSVHYTVVGPSTLEAGYYIDDVSLYRCDTTHTDTSATDDVFIPNIFSPNGDLNNDVLYVRSHNLKDMKLCVYNRWGEMVFESKDINKGWDGRYKKGECNTGVYVYYLTGTLRDGKQVFKKGDVTLVR